MKPILLLIQMTMCLGCNSPANESSAELKNRLYFELKDRAKPNISDKMAVVTEIENPIGCVYIYRGGANGEVRWRTYTDSEPFLVGVDSMLRQLEEQIEKGKINRVVYVIEKQGGPRTEATDMISEVVKKYGISEVSLVHTGL